MRAVQYRILTKILEGIPIPEYIHAFERGRSIPSMAEQHVGKGVVISIDLKDFFTSIKQRQLQVIFAHLGMGPQPSRLLSELCTYESFVPQGALTSPKVSNLVSSLTFGPILRQYCQEHNLTLSIYADDITISAETDIVAERGYAAAKEIIDFVSESVQEFRFKINRLKTKVMRPFQRQYVCGVVVNQRTNLQQRERRRLRAIVHNCVTHGIEHEAAKGGVSPETFVSQITGKINWFTQLNKEAGEAMQARFKAVVDAYVPSTPVSTPVAQATTEPTSAEVPWTE